MPKTKMSAGDPIESRCTKCRKITNHIIVALKEDVPAKVQCNTCGGQHLYRPPTAAKKTVRRTIDPKIAEQNEWQTLKTQILKASAIQYTMSKAFKVGNVMDHPNFGLGLVQKVIGEQKVEVLFEEGKKKMCCSLGR